MGIKTNPRKCAIFVLVFLVSSGRTAKADFTFTAPTSLGETVNSATLDADPSISADGLTLFFDSDRPGGHGGWDIWMTTRPTKDDPWGEPVNLGSSVNGSNWEQTPNISADGLTLYFISNRSGDWDIWVTTRETMDSPWPDAVNLGPTVNSSSLDADPTISADGLSIYFVSNRPGGYGEWDIWVSRRETKDSLWAAPVNLGSTVNSSATEHSISISPDGLSLFFGADQPGGHGEADLWVTLRATVSDTWGEPVNLGPTVNSSVIDLGPSISADGSTLYFFSARAGGVGIVSLWQASIEPVVDLNHDGIVDATDMCIIVDNWHTENSLCDIAPAPFGDGLVDVKDLIVLAEHLFEETPLSE